MMKQRAALLLLLILTMSAAVGFTYIPETVVHDGIAPAENFLVATIRRINDSWIYAEAEFDLAKRRTEELPEKIAEEIQEKIEEKVDEVIDETKEKYGVQ
ncbi:MAG: hypothetical protein J6Q65_03435 [Lentisphaeria bacterium]|nr:hypothetical protein [Lentisphaeria bacterium]